MPVSKKRKKSKQAKREPKHILVNIDKNNNPIDVAPFIMYHPFGNSKSEINTVYKYGEPYAVQSDYLRSYTGGQKNRVLDVRNYIHSVFNDYIANTKDFDQALNIWHKLSDTTVADTLDFTDFTDNAYAENLDAAEKAYDIINTLGDSFDVSWLWSTSQHFDIIVSPRLMYKLVRIGYSDVRESVMYGFVEYERYNLTDDIYITIPMIQGVMDVYCDKFLIDNTGKINIKHCEQLNLNEYYDENVHFIKNVTDSCIQKYGNGFNTVRIDLLGECFANQININEHKKIVHNGEKKKSGLYNVLVDIMTKYALKDLDEVKSAGNKGYVATYRMLRAMSTITASLIISNKLLKDKKLSKPVKDCSVSDPVTIRHEMDIRNQPERKTRILGNNIKIASAERPAVPTMERVIKYHVLEWGRKEHFRKLKSGKIVHVKAAQCTRKCIDKTGTKSNQNKQATDYKIKPEQTV